MIDSLWTTDRLVVRDTVPEDLPHLQRVQQSNRATLLLEGIQEPDSDELQRWLVEGNLPPNGYKERHRLQTISRAENNEAIGYLSVYHGYPDPDTLYIGSLSIRRDFQNCGFGGNLVDTLPVVEGLKDYPTHRLVVSVRNWGAVLFWIRHGFSTIVSVLGKLHMDDGASARLELVRNCSSR